MCLVSGSQEFGELVLGVRRFGSRHSYDSSEIHVFLAFCLNIVLLCANDVWYMLCTNIVVYICFEFKEIPFYFSNYERLDEYMYGTCEVQYLQEDEKALCWAA